MRTVQAEVAWYSSTYFSLAILSLPSCISRYSMTPIARGGSHTRMTKVRVRISDRGRLRVRVRVRVRVRGRLSDSDSDRVMVRVRVRVRTG
jgi:hypothetical protein